MYESLFPSSFDDPTSLKPIVCVVSIRFCWSLSDDNIDWSAMFLSLTFSWSNDSRIVSLLSPETWFCPPFVVAVAFSCFCKLSDEGVTDRWGNSYAIEEWENN